MAICFKLPFKLGCWLLLKISFFYSTNPNPTLEKILHLNLFFCWLAAWRWPYRGSPWQLDPYILIDFTLTENILLFQPLTYKLLKHIFSYQKWWRTSKISFKANCKNFYCSKHMTQSKTPTLTISLESFDLANANAIMNFQYDDLFYFLIVNYFTLK